MADLSPAARAVWEAFNSKFDWVEDGVPGPQFHSVAAALRAAADQVVPADPNMPERWEERDEIRAEILAIVTELENR